MTKEGVTLRSVEGRAEGLPTWFDGAHHDKLVIAHSGAVGRQRSRLPGESGRTMVALCGCRGRKGFAEGWGKRDKGGSKAFIAVVLTDCRVKALCGKEA